MHPLQDSRWEPGKFHVVISKANFVGCWPRISLLTKSIIFLSVFHGHYLDGGFTMPFYKQMLSKPYELEDLESVDQELCRSLGWML